MKTPGILPINLGLLGLVLSWAVLYVFWEPAAVWLVEEDGPLQWLQFALLVAGAVFCYRIFKGHRRHYQNLLVGLGFLLLFLALAFIAAEEISWGQRVLGIESPEIVKAWNSQDETTLHNLWFVQEYRHWALLFGSILGLAMILASDRLSTRARLKPLAVFLPGRYLALAFVLVLISGIGIEIGDQLIRHGPDPEAAARIRFIAGRFSEIGELMVAVAACWYAAVKHQEMRAGTSDWRELAG